MQNLIIETSTDRGVIAYVKDRELLFLKEFLCGQNQSTLLMPYLAECFSTCQIKPADLDCIGIGVGPGSYTGIRVGVSVAQALAFSCNIPLIEISSLIGFVPEQKELLYAAIVDARIGGAYVQKGSPHLLTTELSYPEVCSLENLPGWLKDIKYLVTPNSHSLKVKLERLYPNQEWEWEERFPCAQTLANYVDLAYMRGQVKQSGALNLLYLKETLAERQKAKTPQDFLS